ncbi:hypothetical protein L9F63_017325, partial [Diploptera punctata]
VYQTVDIEDCTTEMLASTLQNVNSSGELVQTLEGDATIQIYQQLNSRPSWLYYQMTINVGNGTIQQHPYTNRIFMDFNIVSGDTSHCKRYTYYYP